MAKALKTFVDILGSLALIGKAWRVKSHNPLLYRMFVQFLFLWVRGLILTNLLWIRWSKQILMSPTNSMSFWWSKNLWRIQNAKQILTLKKWNRNCGSWRSSKYSTSFVWTSVVILLPNRFTVYDFSNMKRMSYYPHNQPVVALGADADDRTIAHSLTGTIVPTATIVDRSLAGSPMPETSQQQYLPPIPNGSHSYPVSWFQ